MLLSSLPTVQLSAATYNVNEGSGSAILTATLSASSSQTVTVQYATSDGTAKAGMDYTAASGTLTFNPGQISATITVPLLDDNAVNEPSPETCFLTLSNPSNANLANPGYYAAIDIAEDSDGGAGLPPAAVAGSSNSIVQVADNIVVPGTPSQSSSGSVRYADGVVTLAQTDLDSSGFGFDWGQTRTWSNGTGYAQGSDNGSGWVDSNMPHLVQADGSTNNTLIFIANGNTASYYDLVNSVYQGRFDDLPKLSYNSSNDTYTLTDTRGDQIVLDGFGTTRPAAQRGEFASYTDPYGTKLTVTSYTSDGHIAEMQRSAAVNGNTTIESWLYSYLPSGNANAGLLSNVSERTQVNGGAWHIVRQVQYAYYDGTQSYGGNLGDLMTATIEDGNSNPLDTSYYRYYTSNSSSGYTNGLEYVFSPDSYLRMTAANPGLSLGNLTDAEVAAYADNYFQYNSAHQVSQETVQGGDSQTSGGLGTYKFSYLASGNTPGINNWSTQTTVTNPDGSTDTVYTNFAAEVLLDDHDDPSSGLHTIEAYQYNSQGQLILDAAPSAVLSYSPSYVDLIHNETDNEYGYYQYLQNTSGLITVYDYNTTTTATETQAGFVAGYLDEGFLEQGQQGSWVRREAWGYFAHSKGFNEQNVKNTFVGINVNDNK